MYLETDRMILRDFTLNDIDDFYEIFSDPIVMENTEPPYDREKSLKFLKEFCIERQPKGGYAAVLKETNKVIGYVLFKSIDEPEIFEIGWIFNKDYWRKGYASEICTELVKYGFEEMKLHKISAEATDEVKSVSLMKRLGMTKEGLFRKHLKSRNGQWLDLHWYAILADDYYGIKGF
jgi:RimJ/RimL family protein N-acetyltransferase